MGNSKSSSAEEAQPSSTSTNEPGPGVFQDAGGEAEGEAEGEENSRRPEKFWNNDFLPLYKLLPYPITPPEGWAKYKSEKKKGRPFGNNHPSPDLWGGNEKKDQIRRITRGVPAPIGPALPSIRPFLNFPEKNRFSKETLKLNPKNKNLYLFSRTCGIRVNKEQRKTLNLWIEGERVIYNATLASVKKKEMPLDLSKLEAAFSTARTEKRKLPDASSSSTRNLRPKQKEVSSFGSDYIVGNAYDNTLKDAAGPEDSDEKNQKPGPKTDASSSTDVPQVEPKYGSGYLLGKKEWLKNVPAVVRVNAVRDVVKACSGIFARTSKGLPGGEIKPRTSAKANFIVVSPQKNNGKSSFKMTVVPPPELPGDNKHGRTRDHMDLNIGYKLGNLRVRQVLPKSVLNHDILIRRSRRGRFFITYVMEKRLSGGSDPLPALPAEKHRRVNASDPGIRAIDTIYETDTGAHCQYGGGAHGREKLKELDEKARKLVSQVAQVVKEKKKAKEEKKKKAKEEENTAKEEENTAKEEARGEENTPKKLKFKEWNKFKMLKDRKWKALDKAKNVRDNMRKQIAADLFHEAGITLLLPALPVQDLARKHHPQTGKRRVLRKGTADEMIKLGHYKLRQFLKHKAVMKGCELVIIKEDYTTKTCGDCGHLNQYVKSKEVFKCNAKTCEYRGTDSIRTDEEMLDKCGMLSDQHNTNCEYESGRDESAARNITILQFSYFLSDEGRDWLRRQAPDPEPDP